MDVFLSSANRQRQARRENSNAHDGVLALAAHSRTRRVHQRDQRFVYQAKRRQSVHTNIEHDRDTQTQTNALLPVAAVYTRQLAASGQPRDPLRVARWQRLFRLSISSTRQQHAALRIARPQLLLVGPLRPEVWPDIQETYHHNGREYFLILPSFYQ